MQISPPFGYEEVVPLYRNQKVRLPEPAEVPKFALGANAIPISYTEFSLALRDYPVVFVTTDEGRTFSAVVVLGMMAGENLFVRNGKWVDGVYIPAYARRYPFCMAKVKLDTVEQQDRLICVEKSYLDENGVEMFDTQGQGNERWREIERLIAEYEADLERSREMCAILLDYSLLEPFSMQATVNQGAPMQLTGMHRVDEKRLVHLNSSQIKNLLQKGVMARIYAHLLSLDSFGRLLERKAALIT